MNLVRRAVPTACVPVVAAWLSCGTVPPEFNADRAFADLERQVAFGPRIPGTPAHDSCANWLIETMRGLADTVEVQGFDGWLPQVDSAIPMRNIIARFHRAASRRVLLGAHWDTRPYADQDSDPANHRSRFDGANDGGSGVAVLIELARALAAAVPPVGVDLAFFDGEDVGEYGRTPGLWCQGSQHFADALDPPNGRYRDIYRWAVIVDMVGGKDLRLVKEGISARIAPDLTERVWEIAADLGIEVFVDALGEDIYDDHIPLLRKGIQAIDLIDMNYEYWHTIHDTPEQCAPASLAAVGRVVLQLVYSE